MPKVMGYQARAIVFASSFTFRKMMGDTSSKGNGLISLLINPGYGKYFQPPGGDAASYVFTGMSISFQYFTCYCPNTLLAPLMTIVAVPLNGMVSLCPRAS